MTAAGKQASKERVHSYRARKRADGLGPDYLGTPRPVVIMQGDAFPGTSAVTVCPLTTDSTDAPLARPLIEPSGENGLKSIPV